jgi:hypothetical protein
LAFGICSTELTTTGDGGGGGAHSLPTNPKTPFPTRGSDQRRDGCEKYCNPTTYAISGSLADRKEGA